MAASLPAENARKNECDYGHPLAGDNLVTFTRADGRRERVCRACARRRSREHHKRHYVPHARQSKPPKPAKPPRQPLPPSDRILARLVRDESGGCWNWPGATSNGYGIVQLGRKDGTARVHRVIYAALVGPIPAGLDVMHTCHNRRCANPAHLQVGTRAENMRQSQEAGRLVRHRVTLTNT